jgi:tetratricopeptide (TPR) repeat protein
VRVGRALRLFALGLAVGGLGGCQSDAPERIRKARAAVFEKKPEQALKEYRLALDAIERAIERQNSAEARVLQARALKGAADVYYLELRDFRRAVEVYQELIRLCPEAPETLEGRIHLADILHAHFNDLRGAINTLTSAIERNAPESAELTYKVAKLYFELGDYQQVTLEAQRVQARYETSPFVDDALLLEAQALAMMEGRAADALRVFERLVERFEDSPLSPHALYEMGKLKAEAGDRERAIEHWVLALDGHPDPAMVQSTIARVRRQIVERTPAELGRAAAANERSAQPVAARLAGPAHRTSIEAAGGTAEEAARDVAD